MGHVRGHLSNRAHYRSKTLASGCGRWRMPEGEHMWKVVHASTFDGMSDGVGWAARWEVERWCLHPVQSPVADA